MVSLSLIFSKVALFEDNIVKNDKSHVQYSKYNFKPF